MRGIDLTSYYQRRAGIVRAFQWTERSYRVTDEGIEVFVPKWFRDIADAWDLVYYARYYEYSDEGEVSLAIRGKRTGYMQILPGSYLVFDIDLGFCPIPEDKMNSAFKEIDFKDLSYVMSIVRGIMTPIEVCLSEDELDASDDDE